ncbi:hypothetical protein PIB30_099781 [Stylosanthes scabra]|uniref:Uncharacterized protein n=1 Tax=Stylosanthes scabra TaxID=79078 RepID=A0ABU6SZD1_9FABA|nr:hypothetical protein [Stylosanthes scabra]
MFRSLSAQYALCSNSRGRWQVMPEILAEFRTLHWQVHRIVSSNKILGLDLVNHVWAKFGTWSKRGLVLVRKAWDKLIEILGLALCCHACHVWLEKNVKETWLWEKVVKLWWKVSHLDLELAKLGELGLVMGESRLIFGASQP